MPMVDWREGFTFARELGRTAEGNFLSVEALRAIHWAHRIGALVTTLVVLAASVMLMRAHAVLKRQAMWIKVALVAQIAIGISTVIFNQPIVVATAHSLIAAALMATLVVAAYRVSGRRSYEAFSVSTSLNWQK